jgi:hypothetical protein
MTKSQAANNPIKLNAEGELVGGKFCEYCGGLNRAAATKCEHCHEHIADQGPDLRSRLQRIHRHNMSQHFNQNEERFVSMASTNNPHPVGQLLAILSSTELIVCGFLFMACLVMLMAMPSFVSPVLILAVVIGISVYSMIAAIMRM